MGADYGLDENLLDDNFVSGVAVGVGRRSSLESRAKGTHNHNINNNHHHHHHRHNHSDEDISSLGGVGGGGAGGVGGGGGGVRQSGGSLGDTLLMQRFFDLLTAHKQSIAETVTTPPLLYAILRIYRTFIIPLHLPLL